MGKTKCPLQEEQCRNLDANAEINAKDIVFVYK